MDLWLNLSWLIVITSVISLILSILKQPILVSYIISGILLSPFGLNIVKPNPVLEIFSELGLILLLFLLGLEMNPEILQHVGKPSIIAGLLQLFLTTLIGWPLVKIFNFSHLESILIAFALSLSSTAVMVKLFSDAKILYSLAGQISIGYLLIQDLVVFIMMTLFAKTITNFLSFLGYLSILFITFLIGEFLFNKFIFSKFNKNYELNFLLTIAWLFIVVSSYKIIGLPVEIGSFLAGLSLASSSIHREMIYKLKPLRDFFVMIFFVLIGTKVNLISKELILPAFILSFFVLIINPLIVYPILRRLKYSPRVSFIASLAVSQTSEFSIIFLSLLNKIGYISEKTISLIVFITLVTFLISSYLIIYHHKLYWRFWHRYIIKDKKDKEEKKLGHNRIKIILLGADRTGESFLENINLENNEILLVDFNPEKVRYWSQKGYQILLHDVADPESLHSLPFSRAEIVISTIPDLELNLDLLKLTKQAGSKFISIATNENESKILKMAGADFVVVPHKTAGHLIAKEIKNFLNHENINNWR